MAELVRRHARDAPEVTAVRASDGTLSFAELDRRADRLAATLAEAGAGPEVAVGVHLSRSVHLVTALLATWRLGAVFVVLDPDHPRQRLSLLLRDAGVSVLVSDPRSALVHEGVPVIDPADVPAFESDVPADPRPHRPDALAYLVYTSGTTGEPKGVSITYRNVAHLVAALGTLAPEEGRAGGNVLAPAFDGWLWSTLIPLAYGRGVVLADPRDGTEGLFAGDVDLVTATPSLLAAHEPPAAEAGLRTVVSAGEACPADLAARWSAGRRFINAYGPTETTICATWADTDAGDDPATIGRPLPGYRVQVLDERLRPVPDGTPGELFISGPGVGRGYHRRPGLTAAAFLPDPTAEAERMYRTGDLVRARPDGTLEYLGRIDRQLKIRGFRVEPAAVASVARTVPGVRSAAAFPLPGPAGHTLGLAVVPETGAGTTLAQQVRTAVAAALPDYMVPASVITVERLPLTVTGKVDESELAELCRQDGAAKSTDDAWGNASEERVAHAWATALGRPVPSAEANFFELGGHSLIATQVVAALRAETGLRLTMRHLFGNPTVRQFAAVLDDLADRDQVSA
ncbi:non-ribosomal peptide synthetase [Streptomyces sp. NPDC001709]